MATLETVLTMNLDAALTATHETQTQTARTTETALGPVPSAESLVQKHYKSVPATDFTVSDRQLGHGGFATVFAVDVSDKATVLSRDKRYALKKSRCVTLVASAQQRLKQEAAVSLALSHCPSIHKSAGGIFERDCNGILMELATESLRDVAFRFGELEQKKTLTGDQRAIYYVLIAHSLLSVVAALEAMHTSHMIHCDVKPANMMVTTDTASVFPRVTLADFGSVLLVADPKKLEEVKVLSGTPFYMAPESLSMPKGMTQQCATALKTSRLALRPKVSRGTDVWALGVSLLELLNFGENPLALHFGSHDAYVVQILPAMCEVTQTDGGTLTTGRSLPDSAFNFALASTAPEALVSLAQKCLVLSTAERYSLTQVRHALEGFLQSWRQAPVAVTPATYTVTVGARRQQVGTLERVVLTYETLIKCIQHNNDRAMRQLEMQAAVYAQQDAAVPFGQRAKHNLTADEEDEAAFGLRMADTLCPAATAQNLLKASQLTGETHRGQSVYRGPRGGRFWVDENMRPRYLPKNAEPQAEAKARVDPATLLRQLATEREARSSVPTRQTYQSSGSANGRALHTGPRGGQYYMSPGGNREYVSRPSVPAPSTFTPVAQPTRQTYQSSSCANGRELHTGPRGGQYYFTAGGNKRYV